MTATRHRRSATSCCIATGLALRFVPFPQKSPRKVHAVLKQRALMGCTQDSVKR